MRKREAYITTSWDDGHPLDFRVAELLTKYGLRGTFYVPMTADNQTITPAQIRELSSSFEIGAHTLHHVVLTGVTKDEAWQEIAGSKSWVENNTGRPCPMFCPPVGRFSSVHVDLVREAGYSGLRTVELGSLDYPRHKAGLLVMPTTIQAYPHGFSVFARNAIKRAAFGNFWRFIVSGPSREWPDLAKSLMRHVLDGGGIFHLWGHSWELQYAGQWQRLEEVLRFLGELTDQAPSLTNGQICQRSLSPRISVQDVAHEGEMRGCFE